MKKQRSVNDLVEICKIRFPDKSDKTLREELQIIMGNRLNDREHDVIKMYFGIEPYHVMTLKEIGKEFNLTQERARQIKEKATRRLQSHLAKLALRADRVEGA